MTDVKCVGKMSDGRLAVFTFSGSNFSLLASVAKQAGVSIHSPEFGELVSTAAEFGLARSVRITDKTREELVKECEDQGYSVRQVKKGEDYGL